MSIETNLILDLLPDMLLILDNQHNILFANKAMSLKLGISKEELIGHKCYEYIHRTDQPLEVCPHSRLLVDGHKHEVEMQEDSIGGDCRVTCLPINDENGKLIGSVHIIEDINELKMAEKSLRESENRYRNIIALAGGVAYQRDGLNTNYTFIDEGIENLTGYTASEINSKLFSSLIEEEIHRPDQGLPKSKINQYFGGDMAYLFQGEYRIRTKDGQIKYVSDSEIQIRNENGEIIHTLGMLQDITERKNSEEILKERENLYRNIIALAGGVAYQRDWNNKTYTFMDESIEELTGYSVDEMNPQLFEDIADSEIPGGFELKIDSKLSQRIGGENAKLYKGEYLIRTKDGQIKYVADSSIEIRDKDNNMIQSFGMLQDITERKQAEFEIQKREKLYHNTIESAGAVPSGKYSGMTKEEAKQRAIEEKSESFQWDIRIKSADGDEKWLLDSSAQIRDENGRLIMELGILQDITEQKHRQIEYQTILHTSLDGFMIVNMDGRVVEVNESYCQMTGYSRDEILKMRISDIDANESPEDTKKHMEIMIEKGNDRFETKHLCKDGKLIDVEVSVTYDSHKNSRFYAFIRDITERKHAEELQIKLQQTSKMESIGRLAGGVAHDFNNMLTVIQGSTTLAMIGLNVNDPIYNRLKTIEEASNRASALTRQLLAFSRKQIIEPKIINLNDVINNLEKMLGRLLGEDIKLEKFLDEKIANINADPGQIEQIIVNLAVNSRDAMPNGGILTIETENISLDENYCRKHPNTQAGDYVQMTISDNGCGMSEETKLHIFEPFFTTKKIGEGTGLGLATVYGIVKQHNGYIECYSEIGHGTTFKIYFPQFNKDIYSDKIDKEKSLDEEMIVKSSGTILLIEDDDIVRELTFEFLKQLGYKVLVAENGGSALIIAEQYSQTIDLIMTDVVMPGLNGREVSERLLKIHPEMKVLYTSGYTQNVIAHHGILEEGINFIGKPYRLETLAKKIRDVLAKRK